MIGINEMSSSGTMHRSDSLKGLTPAHTLALLPQEIVLQVCGPTFAACMIRYSPVQAALKEDFDSHEYHAELSDHSYNCRLAVTK